MASLPCQRGRVVGVPGSCWLLRGSCRGLCCPLPSAFWSSTTSLAELPCACGPTLPLHPASWWYTGHVGPRVGRTHPSALRVARVHGTLLDGRGWRALRGWRVHLRGALAGVRCTVAVPLPPPPPPGLVKGALSFLHRPDGPNCAAGVPSVARRARYPLHAPTHTPPPPPGPHTVQLHNKRIISFGLGPPQSRRLSRDPRRRNSGRARTAPVRLGHWGPGAGGRGAGGRGGGARCCRARLVRAGTSGAVRRGTTSAFQRKANPPPPPPPQNRLACGSCVSTASSEHRTPVWASCWSPPCWSPPFMGVGRRHGPEPPPLPTSGFVPARPNQQTQTPPPPRSCILDSPPGAGGCPRQCGCLLVIAEGSKARGQ